MTRANAALSEVAALTEERRVELDKSARDYATVRYYFDKASAEVARLTEDKARTDAAVNDHLAHLARVTEERDGWRRVAFEHEAEATRLRGALIDVQIRLDDAKGGVSPFQSNKVAKEGILLIDEALAPEGKATWEVTGRIYEKPEGKAKP